MSTFGELATARQHRYHVIPAGPQEGVGAPWGVRAPLAKKLSRRFEGGPSTLRNRRDALAWARSRAPEVVEHDHAGAICRVWRWSDDGRPGTTSMRPVCVGCGHLAGDHVRPDAVRRTPFGSACRVSGCQCWEMLP